MKTIKVADLFCGAGGASTGLLRATTALGLKTELLAVNHWPIAIETHTLNHPDVRHLCESIERVDPRVAVPGGRLQLLIAAPECTHHSTARGGRPVNDQQRAQPWLVLKWLQELYVENLLLENVPEFESWGPLGANGKPLKSKNGQTFRAFLDAIRSLGYTVDHRVLNAADYGDPTTRRRLFVIAKRGTKAIKWPIPTHSRFGGRHLFGQTEKWRAAREVIDWSVQGQSIFDRKRPLSPKTMARVLAGLKRFGGTELKPFLIVLRNNMGARDLDEPLPTLSAGGTHMALIEPEGQASAPFVMPVTHGSDGSKRERSVDDPLPTITGANRGELAVVEPIIVPPRGFDQGERVDSVDAPLRTIVAASGHTFALVEAEVKPTGDPFLAPHFGERPTQAPRTHSIDEPMPTIAATGQIDVVQPFIVSAGGPKVGPITTEQPLNTVLTRDHMALVEPFIVGAGGPEYASKPTSVDDPLGTIMTCEHKALVEPAFIASYYGTQNISPITDPLPTVTTKDRFALVMPVVDGRALDIRLRMLKPHELARAMSFGDDYTFAGNQGDKVKQIGNAWPCRLSQALIQTLIEDYAAKKPKKVTKLECVS